MSIFDALTQNATFFYGVVAIVSLLVGSFLNVVIYRLPIMMERAWREGIEELDQSLISDETDSDKKADATDSPFNLAVPRSRCPSCGHEISALQNIPVISYIVLGGKCGNCKTPISLRYPIIEVVTMMLSLIVAWQFGPTPQALLGIVATWFLVSMTMIDFDHQLLPDTLTLPLMWIGLLAALIPVFADIREAVIGAAAGYMILWSVYQLFRLVTGKEGMGFGDFKLLAAIGAILGWQALPVVILLSSLVGAFVGISIVAVTGRDKNIPIPFGPFLATAGWIAMLWGESLSGWYFGFFN
ncbi:MAG: leader peptidase (prepilin peptidase)/N-methyltransferase [bacterium]|jgi:leader peptidase (prepilin peptidase)/N-methyltransferase